VNPRSPPTHWAQFLRFSAVGAVGFVVDTLALYFCVHVLGANLYEGRVASYFAAATVTWGLNRRFTFFLHRSPARLAELGRFIAANALGGIVNYSTYAIVIAVLDTARAFPVIGVAAGSVAGLAVNFRLSRRLVFRVPAAGDPVRRGPPMGGS